MHSKALNALFPVVERHRWLNHAAISAWPTPVIEATRAFVEENAQQGALNYDSWMAKEDQLRTLIAQFINAPDDDDISLVRNTSEALNIIAQGIKWQAGDEVIFPANEFPSNKLPWERLVKQGVKPVAVSLDHKAPEESLIQAMGAKTRLLAVSSVQFDTGLRLDLGKLSEACRTHGAMLSVDAIQHLGALPLDVQSHGIDFLVCGTHKWLMAPEGMGFLWTRKEAREGMDVALPGWRMYDDPFNFCRTEWTPPLSGKRFETGTVNMFGIHGLAAALQLLQQLDPQQTGEALLDRTDHLVQSLQQLEDIQLITPIHRHQRAGIVCLLAHHLDAEKMVTRLAEENIHIAKRGKNLRISPHFYTPFEHIDAFLERLSDKQWCRHCAV